MSPSGRRAARRGGERGVETFIVENFMGKKLTINCGNDDVFTGVVEDCLNNVLTLRGEHTLVYINVERIVSFQESAR